MTVRTGDWRRERLGGLVEAKYGKPLPQAKRAGGEVPVYGSNGIVGAHNEAVTKGPTIVIGRKGSSGEVNFSPVPCWPIDTTYYIDESGPFRMDFLIYLLRSLRLTERDRSTAIPGLNRDDLYAIEVPVPPGEEQLAIASLLGTIDEAIGVLRVRIDTAERRVQSGFQALLDRVLRGDGVRDVSRHAG